MSNNIEEKAIIKDNEACEEAMESRDNIDELTKEEKPESIQDKASFINAIGASLADQIIISAISVILLYVFEAILRIAGYSISQKVSMIFILFVVVSVVYYSVSYIVRDGKTAGKKLFNL